MMILLLVLAGLTTLLRLYGGSASDPVFPGCSGALREATLKTLLLLGVVIVAFTELASLMGQLTLTTSALLWGGLGGLNIGVLWLRFHRLNFSCLNFDRLRLAFPSYQQQRIPWILGGGIGLILLITLGTALLAPPNNWDAMVYHLPRVRHWIQNQTVAHYPATEARQLIFPPGGGYWVTQFHLLAGNDCFVNVPQWLAFLGSLLGITLLTEMIAGGSARWLSAGGMISIPMAIMQSMTTQTDLLTTLWLVCLVYFVLKPQRRPADWGWIMAALGLAIVTKPTAWVFSAPIVCLWILRLWGDRLHQGESVVMAGLRSTGLALGAIAGSFSLAALSFWRNWQTFGSALGGGETVNTHANASLGWIPLLSNSLKLLAINLPIPGIWPLMATLHNQVLHISLDDPRFSFSPTPWSDPATSQTEALFKVIAPHEDFVGYPLHLLLWIGALVGLGYQRWRRSHPLPWPITALIGITMTNGLLFCLLFKWQPWSNRLLLPVVVLAVPVITYGLVTLIPPQGQTRLNLGLLIIAIAYALTPIRHPLIPLPVNAQEQSPSILQLDRPALYFSGARKNLRVPYEAAVDWVDQTGCTHIGLASAPETWEYPLWVLLSDRLPNFHLRHVNVENPSRHLTPEFPDSALCAVIAFDAHFLPPTLASSKSWQKRVISEDPVVYGFWTLPSRPSHGALHPPSPTTGKN